MAAQILPRADAETGTEAEGGNQEVRCASLEEPQGVRRVPDGQVC